MLVRLFGENFRSLRDPFELSMVAADLKRAEDKGRGVVRVTVEGADEPLDLLRTVAIFGPNASGKTTVLHAGNALKWLATRSSYHSKPEEKIPYFEPFLLDNTSKNKPVKLGCDIVHDNKILHYEIEFSETSNLNEELAIFGVNGETKLFARSLDGKVSGQLIKSSQPNKLYVEGMQPNVSVLSKLAQHGPQKGKGSIHSYYKSINDSLKFQNFSLMSHGRVAATEEKIARFANDEAFRVAVHGRAW